jgi:hypothetical protein
MKEVKKRGRSHQRKTGNFNCFTNKNLPTVYDNLVKMYSKPVNPLHEATQWTQCNEDEFDDSFLIPKDLELYRDHHKVVIGPKGNQNIGGYTLRERRLKLE